MLKILRYLISGGIAAFVNVASLFILVSVFHVWYLAATSVSFVLTLIASFLLQKFWTFGEGSTNTLHMQIGGYALLSFVNLFVNAGLMYFFVSTLGINYLIAQVLTILIIAAYGFFLYQHVIFAGKRPDTAS